MFKGIQKVSLVDYPGVVATTLFTGGCNFRCPWCHNQGLVKEEVLNQIEDLPETWVCDFLSGKKGKIQGVCVSGGEPTLWGEDLASFLEWCKKEGFLVKLDTNGYLPEVLESYIEKNLLDFVAMDIKNVFSLYSETVGLEEVDLFRIKRSIEVIQKSGIRHQFRSTLVRDLVDPEALKVFNVELGEAIFFQDYREIRTVF
jgi:pyruvate formate lyase activating enzyme